MMGLSLLDHRDDVGPAQGPHLGAEPFPDSSHCRLARLDQQLASVPADVVTQEVKALIESDNPCLVLVESQSPGLKPPGKPRLDLKRLGLCVTQGDEVIGVPDQDRRVFHRLAPAWLPAFW